MHLRTLIFAFGSPTNPQSHETFPPFRSASNLSQTTSLSTENYVTIAIQAWGPILLACACQGLRAAKATATLEASKQPDTSRSPGRPCPTSSLPLPFLPLGFRLNEKKTPRMNLDKIFEFKRNPFDGYFSFLYWKSEVARRGGAGIFRQKQRPSTSKKRSWSVILNIIIPYIGELLGRKKPLSKIAPSCSVQEFLSLINLNQQTQNPSRISPKCDVAEMVRDAINSFRRWRLLNGYAWKIGHIVSPDRVELYELYFAPQASSWFLHGGARVGKEQMGAQNGVAYNGIA